MKLDKKIIAAATAAIGASISAHAAPVLLGSVEHLYGTNPGRQAESIMGVYHPGGNCDTLNATSVTVRATSASSCNRFADIFNFSNVDFASIDHFDVTLSFSGAQNGFFELWNTRAAPNYVASATTFGDFLNASGPQTFTFGNTAALFNNIVAAEQFVLSFAQNGLGGTGSNFTLNSARLDVFGTAAVADVPEPSSLALVGLLLAGGTLVGRSRKGSAG